MQRNETGGRRQKQDARGERQAEPSEKRPVGQAEKRSGRQAEKRPVGQSEKRPPRQPRSQPEALPVAEVPGAVRVSRRAADRLQGGHVWVYRSDVEAWPEGSEPDAAGLMPVVDRRGAVLGTGLYSPASEIALRIVCREAVEDWLQLLQTRLRAAIDRRRPLLDEQNDACRLVFSEADELPGITVDQYAGLAIVQLRHKALDNDEVRQAVVATIREAVDPETIIEREDPRIRELEQLSAPASAILFAKNSEQPVTSTVFQANGLEFQFDATSGQKTGAFLDQRENYAAAARWARGEALDVCTYQGGFALHMARVCERVTGVDVSRSALEVAEQNLERNRSQLRATTVDWVEADAFDLLRGWSDAGTQYDTIVLDPPAFAKSRRAVEGALRGYRELNLRALKMLGPGGRLVTCSCSHHVSLADFMNTLRAAAGDAGRRVRLLEVRGAAADHPVVLNIPETDYLKCVVLEAF